MDHGISINYLLLSASVTESDKDRMNIFKSILAVFSKDLKSEFRTRYAISSFVLFILTTITMILFGTANEEISEGMAAGILWIIMFFGAMTGLARAFVSEVEKGTDLLLKLSADSAGIYFGKLLFNILLCLSLNILAVLLYLLLINPVVIELPLVFMLVIILGSLGLAGATTIISAIIARAGSKNALFPVLSFPVLLPMIIVGIQTTRYSFDGKGISSPDGNFYIMAAYCGIIITTSYLLFEFVWKD